MTAQEYITAINEANSAGDHDEVLRLWTEVGRTDDLDLILPVHKGTSWALVDSLQTFNPWAS
jgi:hypothetical protein|tara:strand:- start:324 stop:509 length:186 start_codon:yes stop_codon:yes gene_type:complete